MSENGRKKEGAGMRMVSLRFQEHGELGRVAHLTIERPEKLNSLNPEVLAVLTAAAAGLQDEADLRAVVLTGAGPRAFIGGADIGAMAGLDAAGARAFITALHEAIAAIRAIPVPVIARINGHCLGGGFEVAAGCDLRIASDNATFGMPEVKFGIPSVIEAALLPRLIGWGKAAELVYLGHRIDAAEALACGFVSKVVPAAELDAAVEGWLGQLLENGPKALRLQKALLKEWERLSLDRSIAAGIETFAAAYRGDEPARFMAAFAARGKR